MKRVARCHGEPFPGAGAVRAAARGLRAARPLRREGRGGKGREGKEGTQRPRGASIARSPPCQPLPGRSCRPQVKAEGRREGGDGPGVQSCPFHGGICQPRVSPELSTSPGKVPACPRCPQAPSAPGSVGAAHPEPSGGAGRASPVGMGVRVVPPIPRRLFGGFVFKTQLGAPPRQEF